MSDVDSFDQDNITPCFDFNSSSTLPLQKAYMTLASRMLPYSK